MGVPDVEQAKRRLQDILRKAQKLEIPAQEVISTRSAQKLLARTRNVPAWMIWIAVFVLLLSGVVYARWPTRQEVETIRTVLRRTNVHLSASCRYFDSSKSIRKQRIGRSDLYEDRAVENARIEARRRSDTVRPARISSVGTGSPVMGAEEGKSAPKEF
ncbi:uncharacterized protein LOC143214709 isoform X1 [Lasioglossum baleicum]|uniref:uncharacterized protein LOC143214709 isoform X1 n=1 Tax=Lasioglossum baleicum TaxID=434251 RepID=UPI003FCE5231